MPISIAGATRVSTLTLSITYNPALIRVRNVQEGTFMRQGGITPAFNDVMAGQVPMAVTGLAQSLPYHRNGRLRILGCRRVERHAGREDRIQSAPVGLPVPAIELDRIHVAAG